MTETIRGLHHVTAIAIDPQANIDFYTRLLGLRLVKETVNFDDPGTYHFYYGDTSGHPGTILTFFPFVSAGRGRSGSGMVDAVTFAVPGKSLDGWVVRLAERGIDVDGPFTRFSRPVIGCFLVSPLRSTRIGRITPSLAASWPWAVSIM